MSDEWTPGWFVQYGLLVAAAVAMYFDAKVVGSVYLTGSMLIGVMRQLHRDRHDRND